MEGEKKNYFFVCIFDISPRVFYSNFDQESSLDAELNSTSNEYPLSIILMGLTTQKKYLKKCDDDIIIMFFQVFLVFGVEGSIKSMQSGYSLDVEFNFASRGALSIEI